MQIRIADPIAYMAKVVGCGDSEEVAKVTNSDPTIYFASLSNSLASVFSCANIGYTRL